MFKLTLHNSITTMKTAIIYLCFGATIETAIKAVTPFAVSVNSYLVDASPLWSLLSSTLKKYVFDDVEYLKFLGVVIICDTTLGLYKAWKEHRISSKGFSMVINKFVVYSAALITTHVLEHYTIRGKTNIVFGWLDSVVFCAIMAREAISIFENISILQPGLFPKWILKRLSQFDSITGQKKNDELQNTNGDLDGNSVNN